jgi:hypothetical protein
MIKDWMSVRSVALFVFLVAVATRLPAQSDAARADTADSRECWRGHRPPVCRSFFLTEFGVVRVRTSSASHFSIDYGQQGGVVHYSEPDFANRLQFTVGPMFNTSSSRALGATVSFSAVHNGFRAALEGRHRWWGPANAALDLSAGALRIDVPSVSATDRRTEYGMTAGAHLVSGDLVHATGRADVTVGHGGPRVGMSVELGVGGWLTAVVAPVVLLGNSLSHAIGET